MALRRPGRQGKSVHHLTPITLHLQQGCMGYWFSCPLQPWITRGKRNTNMVHTRVHAPVHDLHAPCHYPQEVPDSTPAPA
eukprot:6459898-Amphidinium_carterae.1